MYFGTHTPRGDIRGRVLRLAKIHQRLTPPFTVQIVHYINSSSVSYTLDGTGADGARSEGGKRILLDNSRVYVRFLPFVSGRVHLARISAH